MYDAIVAEFQKHPRDVHTVPLVNKPHIWFYVFVENGKLYVESAHNNTPKSSAKKRVLSQKECSRIWKIYQERKAGKSVSNEAQANTHSQVYWYGIFSELQL